MLLVDTIPLFGTDIVGISADPVKIEIITVRRLAQQDIAARRSGNSQIFRRRRIDLGFRIVERPGEEIAVSDIEQDGTRCTVSEVRTAEHGDERTLIEDGARHIGKIRIGVVRAFVDKCHTRIGRLRGVCL